MTVVGFAVIVVGTLASPGKWSRSILVGEERLLFEVRGSSFGYGVELYCFIRPGGIDRN